MKWIGQHIWDLISRFRYYVYIEKADPSTSTKALVVDEDGKVGTNSAIAAGGVDSVTTKDTSYINLTPNTPTVGDVVVTAALSAVDGTAVADTRFLSKANTWDIPLYNTFVGTVTSVTAMIDGNCLTISTAASHTITTSGTFDFEFAGTAAQYINGAGDLITFPTIPAAGVTTFTSTAGTYINITANAAAAGAVSVGTVDLNAVDGTSDVNTRFLSKDNTWDVPTYTAAGVTTFSNGNGIFVGNQITNTNATGAVTLGRVDLTATGTPDVTKFLCGDNTWKVPAYAAGTVTSIGLTSDAGSTSTITTSGTFTIAGGTNVTTSATGTTVTVNSTDQYTGTVTAVTGTLPIVSSGGATPVISINAATLTTSGAVELATAAETGTGTSTTLATTPAGVKRAIDARYTYQYISFHGNANIATNWAIPGTNGPGSTTWSTNTGVSGTAVDGSVISSQARSKQNGFVVPYDECILVGFYGLIRNNSSNVQGALGLFHNSFSGFGANTAASTLALRAYAAADQTGGSGSSYQGFCIAQSMSVNLGLTAGDIICPAILQPAQKAYSQFTIVIKTPIL
tara:strand:- start:6748 stop:8454 length:1707 start_codon:yes stop_codon:yes gene_type:complete